MRTLKIGHRRLALDPPLVMGVLNVTPDSFSDGGEFLDPELALARARRLREEGADLIDVGGESTRPGAQPVPTDVQIARVVPVIERIVAELDVPVSIDTSDPRVMQAAIAAGAGLVNDVRGLRRPGALEVIAASGAAVCVMHMQGEPDSMQLDPRYADVVAEVRDYLAARIQACRAAGIAADSIVIDPGFGFGKSLAHHVELFRHLEAFTMLGAALLVGVSRKSMLGTFTGRAVEERDAASVAAAAILASRGADIVRAHAVGATRDAVRVGAAVRRPRE